MSVAFLLVPVLLTVILLLPYTEWLQPPYNKSCLGFGVFFSFLSMFTKPVMAGTSPGLKRDSYSYKSRSSFWKQLVALGVYGFVSTHTVTQL